MIKKLYLLFILSLLSGCAVMTATNIETAYTGIYKSIDVVMPEQYLWVKVGTSEIIVYFGAKDANSPSQDAVTISGDNSITGLDPSYSFQSGTIVGHVTFSERELYITYISATADGKDTVALHNVKCVKQEGQS